MYLYFHLTFKPAHSAEWTLEQTDSNTLNSVSNMLMTHEAGLRFGSKCTIHCAPKAVSANTATLRHVQYAQSVRERELLVSFRYLPKLSPPLGSYV